MARFLGLGYPGGPAIDRAAVRGDPRAFAFPRALADDGFDFSFSGLKTAVVRTVERQPSAATDDVAASFQEAVVDVLVAKAGRAVAALGASGPLPGRRGGRQLAAPPAGRRGRARPPGCRRTCPAGPCAPTTRPWWRPPGPGGWPTTGRARCRWPPTPTCACPSWPR